MKKGLTHWSRPRSACKSPNAKGLLILMQEKCYAIRFVHLPSLWVHLGAAILAVSLSPSAPLLPQLPCSAVSSSKDRTKIVTHGLLYHTSTLFRNDEAVRPTPCNAKVITYQISPKAAFRDDGREYENWPGYSHRRFTEPFLSQYSGVSLSPYWGRCVRSPLSPGLLLARLETAYFLDQLHSY